MARAPHTQPAMPPDVAGTRGRVTVAVRAARRGWALVRGVALVLCAGFLGALVMATLFAALVIAINGRLP